MTVEVEVYAQRNARAPETLKVSDAALVYVAIDNQGKPRAIDS
jgi:acyl-CoA thioesterase YciA